jgi:predicted transcriptional regulator
MVRPVFGDQRKLSAQTTLRASNEFLDWLGRLSEQTRKSRQDLMAEGIAEWAKNRGMEPAPPRL